MTTGIIKLDSIAEAFEKVASHECVSLKSGGGRSSSGVSSASPSASEFSNHSFSNPLADGYCTTSDGSTLELDPAGLLRRDAQPPAARNACTGVVALSDELWLDIEAHLKVLTDPKYQPDQSSRSDQTFSQRCRHFVQSKWRSISVSMVPMKSSGDEDGDEKPLTPPIGQGDEIEATASSGHAHDNPTFEQTPSPSVVIKPGAAPNGAERARDPPPFSCTPVYIVIIVAIFLVLVIGAITTIVDLKPEFLYGRRSNLTASGNSTNSTGLL